MISLSAAEDSEDEDGLEPISIHDSARSEACKLLLMIAGVWRGYGYRLRERILRKSLLTFGMGSEGS